MRSESSLYSTLSKLAAKPSVWSSYTADRLWDDDYISGNMLRHHLDPESEPASRPHSFIDKSADWIISRFGLTEGKLVADFGCGPGLYCSRLATSGAAVTGIDFSRGSINYARDQARRDHSDIKYIQGNYLEFSTRSKFDLITLIYCDYCALNPEQRSTLLSIIRNSLVEGGKLLLDVFTVNAYISRSESNEFSDNFIGGFWAEGDHLGVRHTWKYNKEKVILDKYDIIEPHRKWQVFNWLQYFAPEALKQEFNENGLLISNWHEDVAGKVFTEDAEIMTVVAEKSK